MRISKLQSNKHIKRKIKEYIYKIERVSNGFFKISKLLNKQLISQYLVELQGFCTCPDFQRRRIKNNQACKHIQMLLLALAEDPEFKQGVVFFDEKLKKLL